MGLLQTGKIKQMMKLNTTNTHIQTIKMPPKILPAPATSSVATTISKFKALGTNVTHKVVVPSNKTTILNKSAGSSGVAQKSFIKINANQNQSGIQAINVPGKGVSDFYFMFLKVILISVQFLPDPIRSFCKSSELYWFKHNKSPSNNKYIIEDNTINTAKNSYSG